MLNHKGNCIYNTPDLSKGIDVNILDSKFKSIKIPEKFIRLDTGEVVQIGLPAPQCCYLQNNNLIICDYYKNGIGYYNIETGLYEKEITPDSTLENYFTRDMSAENIKHYLDKKKELSIYKSILPYGDNKLLSVSSNLSNIIMDTVFIKKKKKDSKEEARVCKLYKSTTVGVDYAGVTLDSIIDFNLSDYTLHYPKKSEYGQYFANITSKRFKSLRKSDTIYTIILSENEKFSSNSFHLSNQELIKKYGVDDFNLKTIALLCSIDSDSSILFVNPGIK